MQLAAFMELKDSGGGRGDVCRNKECVFGHVLSNVPISHPLKVPSGGCMCKSEISKEGGLSMQLGSRNVGVVCV